MSSLQKKLAAKVLKVGVSRIWIDPAKREDVEKAITKWDIRKLIKRGIIKALPSKLHKPKDRTKNKRGAGSRKGKKYSIVPRKRKWIATIRPLRRFLKDLKSSGEIDNRTYRKMRLLTKGGVFRNRSHLRTYLEQHIQTLFPGRRVNIERFISGSDTAVVLVEGIMPTMASRNENFDVRVSALDGTQTTSLEGGWLLGTELKSVGTFGITTRIVAEAKGTLYLTGRSLRSS